MELQPPVLCQYTIAVNTNREDPCNKPLLFRDLIPCLAGELTLQHCWISLFPFSVIWFILAMSFIEIQKQKQTLGHLSKNAHRRYEFKGKWEQENKPWSALAAPPSLFPPSSSKEAQPRVSCPCSAFSCLLWAAASSSRSTPPCKATLSTPRVPGSPQLPPACSSAGLRPARTWLGKLKRLQVGGNEARQAPAHTAGLSRSQSQTISSLHLEKLPEH